jgi:protein SCO1/2
MPISCRRAFTVGCLGLLTLLIGHPFASAHSEHPQAAPQESQEAKAAPARVALHDVELLDQDGKRVRFKSDVVGDRLVALDTIYTTCPVVCPILSASFANVQEALGSRLGREVLLVSISVDPVTDSPARLKAYAKKWGARPGWVFLTGAKPNVDRVLQGLGLYATSFTDHSTMVLVGDGTSQMWSRFYGLPVPERILDRLNSLTAARRRATTR